MKKTLVYLFLMCALLAQGCTKKVVVVKGNKVLPPGQAKKELGLKSAAPLAPGQLKKQTNTKSVAPGQSKKNK